MQNKVTWEKIFGQFRRSFPNLSRDVIHWVPYNYATILVYLADGRKATYEYDSNKIIFL